VLVSHHRESFKGKASGFIEAATLAAFSFMSFLLSYGPEGGETRTGEFLPRKDHTTGKEAGRQLKEWEIFVLLMHQNQKMETPTESWCQLTVCLLSIHLTVIGHVVWLFPGHITKSHRD